MKKLIKLMSILCALLMLLSFGLVGCSDGDEESDEPSYKKKATLNNMTAEEVYNDILETMNMNSGNFTSTTNYKIKCAVNAGGQKFNMNLTMTDICAMDSEGDFYEKTYVDAGEMAGMDLGEITNEVWLIEGYAFINQNDTVNGVSRKLKCEVTWDQLLNYLELDADSWFNPIYDFSDTAFDEVKFYINEEDKNDVYFDIILDGTEAAAFANKLFEKQGNTGMSMDIDEIQYRFILNKNGELDHVEIDFVANVENSGMTMKYTYDGTIEFSKIGTTEVEMPTDSETYAPGYLPGI